RLALSIIAAWPYTDAAAGAGTLALLVSKIETKPIDYLSNVEDGTILAQLDPRLFQAEVDQATHTLAMAQANQLQLEANFHKAQGDWLRAKDLNARGAIAQADYDLALANFETTQANVGVGKATISQAQAALRSAQTNLDYTTIRSPVKGVIIDR